MKVIQTIGIFSESIEESLKVFDGDQLQFSAIFNFTGASVKSPGILKDGVFFHIKKSEEEINFETYFSDDERKFLRKKF